MADAIIPIKIETLHDAARNRGLLAKMPDGREGVIAHVQDDDRHNSVCLEWRSSEYQVDSRIYRFNKDGKTLKEIEDSSPMHSKDSYTRYGILGFRKGIWGIDAEDRITEDRITEDWRKRYGGAAA